MIPKRRLSRVDDNTNGSAEYQPATKRARAIPSITNQPPSRDLISSLPAELLVRTFSYFSETDLLAIAPVSRQFHHITSDRQLWRLHYLRRFILPRAHQIPGFKKDKARQSVAIRDGLRHGEEKNAGEGVDWMKNYKLLHNWARGRCGVDEVKLQRKDMLERTNKTPKTNKTLVKIVDGLAITADAESGLMVWDLRTRAPVAQTRLADVRPTCLAVDDDRLLQGDIGVAVGFEDGSFDTWRTNLSKQSINPTCHSSGSRHTIEMEAIAYCHPYAVSASIDSSVSIWTLEGSETQNAPYLLRSLRSYTTRAPLTLSTRRVGAGFVASIAYTVDTVGGWSIGIQDFDIRPSLHSAHPEIIDSRLSHTVPSDSNPSPSSSPERSSNSPSSSSSSGPIRLCYSHPYLLATLPDNTLLLHLVTTTSTSLSIGKGIRLWGHTSGISDAEITARGKAVSVSARGDEIRVWELEGRVGGRSVEVRPRATDEIDEWKGLGEWWKSKVGFDEEMVIVLKEAGDGRESLMVYDFT